VYKIKSAVHLKCHKFTIFRDVFLLFTHPFSLSKTDAVVLLAEIIRKVVGQLVEIHFGAQTASSLLCCVQPASSPCSTSSSDSTGGT